MPTSDSAVQPTPMATDLNGLAAEITSWRADKGFSTPSDLSDPNEVIVKLALAITELSEAIEAVRAKVVDEANFREEIADAVIRILDLTGAMGIDLQHEIELKMDTNRGRPRLHGKRA